MKLVIILLHICSAVGIYRDIIPDVIPTYDISVNNYIELNDSQEQQITIQKFFNESIGQYVAIIKTDNCFNQTRYYKNSYNETNLKQITYYENCQIVAKFGYYYDDKTNMLYKVQSEHWINNTQIYWVKYRMDLPNIPSSAHEFYKYEPTHFIDTHSCVEYRYYEPTNKVRIVRGTCLRSGKLWYV